VTEPSLLMRSGALCDDVWRSARLSGAGFFADRKQSDAERYNDISPSRCITNTSHVVILNHRNKIWKQLFLAYKLIGTCI